MCVTAAVVTQLAIFCQGNAWAHAGAIPETIDIHAPHPTERISLQSTMGYIRGPRDGPFEWLCHETVTTAEAVITPRYTENANGVVLARVPDLNQARSGIHSLYRTEDGCTWPAVTDIEDHLIADVAFDPNDPNHVLAITANEDAPNFLYRSRDAGLSWQQQDLEIENRIFRSILFSPGTVGIWMTAVRFETNQGWVFHSDDKGESWTEHPIELPAFDDRDVYVDVLIADGEDPNQAWFVVGPYLDDQLLETRDAGQSFREVYAPDGDIIDGTQDGNNGLWIIVSGGNVIYSENGTFFERVEDAPGSMGITASPDRVYLAHRLATEATAASSTEDGQSFQPIDVFSEVNGPPSCPPESESAKQCDPLWEELQPAEDSAAESTPTDPPAASMDTAEVNPPSSATKGCCASGQTQTSVALLALLPVWMRKRQTTGKKSASCEP